MDCNKNQNQNQNQNINDLFIKYTNNSYMIHRLETHLSNLPVMLESKQWQQTKQLRHGLTGSEQERLQGYIAHIPLMLSLVCSLDLSVNRVLQSKRMTMCKNNRV